MPALYGLPDRRAMLIRMRRASATFDDADEVHSVARTRLLARLPLFALNPRRIVDLGAATGKASLELAGLYPEASIIAMDVCRPMASRAMARCRQLNRTFAITGDAERMPLRDSSVDLMFSNLLLPWCDPEQVFRESARVLRDGGLLLFTTVGPDTLRELRQAWSEVDDGLHVHGFVDMHDLGDLATRAGLAEPVLDIDRLTVRYPNIGALVAELRACGATNTAHGRRSRLTGRGRWQAFAERIAVGDREESRVGGRSAEPGGKGGGDHGGALSVSVELVFGQAWGTGAGAAHGTGQAGDVFEAAIPISELRRRLRGTPE